MLFLIFNIMSEFSELVDRITDLSLDSQAVIVDLMNNRFHEAKREQIRKDVIMGREDFFNGNSKSGTIDQLIEEILYED